jgi:hypothetical protein
MFVTNTVRVCNERERWSQQSGRCVQEPGLRRSLWCGPGVCSSDNTSVMFKMTCLVVRLFAVPARSPCFCACTTSLHRVQMCAVHIVTNETIDGVEMGDPDVGEHVLVSDMTSTLLSR